MGLVANASVRIAGLCLPPWATPLILAGPSFLMLVSIGLSYWLAAVVWGGGTHAGAAIAGWLEALALGWQGRRRLGGLRLPVLRWLQFLAADPEHCGGVAALAKDVLRGAGPARLPLLGLCANTSGLVSYLRTPIISIVG